MKNKVTNPTVRTGETWINLRSFTDDDLDIIEILGLSEDEVDAILANECETTLARTYGPLD